MKVFESVTRLKVGLYAIRIWREEASLEDALAPDFRDFNDCKRLLEEAMQKRILYTSYIVQCFCDLARVSAVELIPPNRDSGCVVYNDWP